MQRFLNSAKCISMPVPHSLDDLCEACREVARAAGPEGDYLRPISFWGLSPTGNIGVNPLKCPVNTVIACTHMGAYMGAEQLERGATIITSSWEKPSNRAALLNAKVCGNYINSVVARIEAVKRGADEALMLNAEGNVAEGTGENLFMVKAGRIFTPPMTAGILGRDNQGLHHHHSPGQRLRGGGAGHHTVRALRRRRGLHDRNGGRGHAHPQHR